jgi:hypothetical protein
MAVRAALGVFAMTWAIVFLSPRVSAGEPRHARLNVVRTPQASSCPDGATLAAVVARVSGREVLDAAGEREAPPTGGPTPRFDVMFARETSGYIAVLVTNGEQSGSRTIQGNEGSCDSLGEAVAATITVVLDELDAAARAQATPPDAGSPPEEARPAPPPAQSMIGGTPRWVDRPLTLPAGRFALDVGFGGASLGVNTGTGANVELAAGITDRVEVGVRSGFRFEHADGADYDAYARLFDEETFDEGTIAGSPPSAQPSNPEIRIRGATIRDAVGELALEGRVIIPLGSFSNPGFVFGIPLAFHAGDRVRVDTGVYQRVLGEDVTFSVPVDLWVQITPRFWFGPRAAAVLNIPGPNPGPYENAGADISLGFGAGYQVLPFLDVKVGIFDPAVINFGDHIGGGIDVQIRVN